MMTPREGSQLCIKMAGYGIRHDVVETIQNDARKDLLEEIKRLESQIKIKDDAIEYHYNKSDARKDLLEEIKRLESQIKIKDDAIEYHYNKRLENED